MINSHEAEATGHRRPNLERARQLIDRPNRRKALAIIGRHWAVPSSVKKLDLPIVGEIGRSTELEVAARLAANPHVSSVRISINSNGGLVGSARKCVRELTGRFKPEQIEAHVVGVCASSACEFLAIAGRRTASANARIIVHRVEILHDASKGRLTADRLELYRDAAERHDQRLINLYCSFTGLSEDAVATLLETSAVMVRERARYLGFINA